MHSIRLSVIIFTVTRWGGYRRGEGEEERDGKGEEEGEEGVDKRRLGKA
jgi:hypothetical protein